MALAAAGGCASSEPRPTATLEGMSREVTAHAGLADANPAPAGVRRLQLRSQPAAPWTMAVQIRFEDGNGVVFDYVDDKNYMELRPWPHYGTWTLRRVSNGSTTTLRKQIRNTTDPEVIEIRRSPTAIQAVYTNGKGLDVNLAPPVAPARLGIEWVGTDRTMWQFDVAGPTGGT